MVLLHRHGFRPSVLALLVWLVWSACAAVPERPSSVPPTPAPPAVGAADSEQLEIEALLLLIGDRRIFEPLVVGRALESPHANLRWRLALVLGQVGDPRGFGPLANLLTDKEPMVRRAAAFALGRVEIADTAIDERLARAALDADLDTGVAAVASLARRGVSLERVASGLADLASEQLLARLMPSLFRFRGPAVIRWAQLGLEARDPAQRAWAAYGLAREPQAAAAELLRDLTRDADPWVAGWAARGLGRVGDRSDPAHLEPLLARPETGPVVQALRAIRALAGRGAAAPPATWRETILRLLGDARSGVRIAALEVAGLFLGDENPTSDTPARETIGASLAARVTGAASERERILALAALAEGHDPRAEGLLLRAATDPSPAVRQGAAEAAAAIGAGTVLERLAADADAGVREAVLALRLAELDTDADRALAAVPAIVHEALGDADPGLRAVVLAWAAEHPVVPAPAVASAMVSGDRILDAQLAGIRALAARAEAVPSERDEIIASLGTLSRGGAFVVRRAAVAALVDLGREAPAVGQATRRPVAFYREIVAQTHEPYTLSLETERGAVTLRLECALAPIGCLSFLQLARQGFYDGLTFHRVIPDFVVQSGDPRGDGRGGPGFRVRGEPNRLRYARGVLGMARGEPDTAGSQFFITLSAQPHLDGDYTAFGEVVAGMDVLDRIVQGDRIVRFVTVP